MENLIKSFINLLRNLKNQLLKILCFFSIERRLIQI